MLGPAGVENPTGWKIGGERIEMEREWQEDAAVEGRLPDREAIRLRELTRVIGNVMRLRIVIVAVVGLFLLALIGAETSTVRRLVLAGLLVPLVALAMFDRHRIGRYRMRAIPFDLAIIATMQTTVICLSGGAESPLLFILVVVPLLTGITLGIRRSSILLIAYVSLLLWIIAVLGFSSVLPKTVPDLLDLGPGYVERTTYVVASTGVINLILLVSFRVGALIHATINSMLDNAIGARQNALISLSERNAELLQLSSAIAHELKNPLASVQGLVQLLKRGGNNSAQRIEVLEREVARMRDTLDAFLNFSRPLGELSLRPLDVLPLMQELTQIHDGMTESRSIRLDLPPSDPGALRADRRKLEQALVNLLQNAIEAVREGGHIRWVADRRDDAVELGVEDDGPGLDPKLLARIQRGPGTTTKQGGSGIGLQVARTIAEQHGGTLHLEGRPGGGTRAVLRLPLSDTKEEAA